MNKARKMLTGVTLAVVTTMIIPIKTLATETTNLEMVKTGEEKYIIYIQDLQKTEFNYAISENQTTQENDLKYFKSTQDDDENQVAVVEKNVYDFAKSSKAYLWIKQDEKQIVSAQEIDFTKAFEKSKIEEVENISKRINTEIISDLLEEERTDENGVKIITTVGGIKIKDEEKAKYFYQLMPATDEYGTLMETAEKIKNEYNNADMYTTIKLARDFYEKYNTLITTAKWNEVQEMEIRQPKDATEGSKYVVFIKKVDGNSDTYDVKFLTSQEEQNSAYEKENKVVQEEKNPSNEEEQNTSNGKEENAIQGATKLPITGDSLAIVIAFVVVVGATIFVFFKMKKSKKESDK